MRQAAIRARSRARKPASRSRTAKISLTVDSAILRDTKAVARRTGRTLSAHVSEALARDLRRRRLAQIIAEYEAEAGVVTDDEVAAVRATWRA